MSECGLGGSLSFLSSLTQLDRFIANGNHFASALPSDIGKLRWLR
jgi:hypothetical protein